MNNTSALRSCKLEFQPVTRLYPFVVVYTIVTDSDSNDELDKDGTNSESEAAETSESSSDSSERGSKRRKVRKEVAEKSQKLETAKKISKKLNANIAAQEATNDQRNWL